MGWWWRRDPVAGAACRSQNIGSRHEDTASHGRCGMTGERDQESHLPVMRRMRWREVPAHPAHHRLSCGHAGPLQQRQARRRKPARQARAGRKVVNVVKKRPHSRQDGAFPFWLRHVATMSYSLIVEIPAPSQTISARSRKRFVPGAAGIEFGSIPGWSHGQGRGYGLFLWG